MPAILALVKATPGVISAWASATKKYREGTLTADDVIALEAVIDAKEADIANS
jgi:hypothetical protein